MDIDFTAFNQSEMDLIEELSDKVRRGVPIDFFDALAVIEYQRYKKDQKKKSCLLEKIKRLFKR